MSSTGAVQGAVARLLIVDDERNQMIALRDTLSERGFVTTGFVTPEEALLALSHQDFDLLLTDLMMPGMDGIQLLRAAQAIRPQIVGVLMTGHGTIDTAVEAMKVGALDYILKPFKLSAVLPVIGRALAIRDLRVENAALQARLLERTQELEAANTDLAAFSASVSHDLMAPLRAIRGYAELLDRDVGPQLSETSRTQISRIVGGAQRLQDLIRDLLVFAKLGRQELAKGRVAMGPLVQRVVDDLRQQQPERTVTVDIADLPDAHADPSLLTQVLVNLLSNAFKFTRHHEAPRVEIGHETRGDQDIYFVRDNGAGFDERYAKRLFGIFQRLHSEKQFEGTGVGLSMVRRILERHGGTVWAESTVGQGATFRFSLPSRPARSSTDAPPATGSPGR